MERASRRRRTVRACITGLLVLFLPPAVFPQSEKQTSVQNTQVVLLGTGTPSPDPERSGPATAVVVNGTPYLIDFGPGVVRRIAAASQQGVAGLGVVNVRVAFLTHFHSDHTAGYADLILTPWSVGRSRPLEVYGPKGLKHMTDHLLKAYRDDIAIRRRDKQILGVPEQADGYKVQTDEITPGTVYKDPNVTVKAFLVHHGDVRQSFGYRIETADRTIVISGDAAPSQGVIDGCSGCDVLIHEAYSNDDVQRSVARLSGIPPETSHVIT
jgi:ribonuclease BN (tRNA processing enzyme)